MLCQIFICAYRMKNKYRNKIYNPVDECINLSYMQKHNKRECYYFTEWELRYYDFSPEDDEHMKWLFSHLRPCDYLVYASSASDWYPDNPSFYTEITCVKVVHEGKIVNMDNYIKDYEKKRHERYLQEVAEINIRRSTELPYRYQFRHPKTTNEKRNHLSPQEIREFQCQGYHIKERQRRSRLPDAYDEISIHYGKCWKDKTKAKKQYLKSFMGKRKNIRGIEI